MTLYASSEQSESEGHHLEEAHAVAVLVVGDAARGPFEGQLPELLQADRFRVYGWFRGVGV